MEDELEKTAETTEDDVSIETEDVATDADSDENDADFSDADGEDGEAEGDGEQDAAADADADKPWKNEKNAEAAQKRRDAEARREAIYQANIEKAQKKARYDTVIDLLGGTNPYTNEKIEDDADVEEYLTMKEIEKAGKDPLSDYSRYLKNKAKEQQQAQQSQASREEWYQKDREDFAAKHPDVKLDELIADEMFKTFAQGKIGTVSMTDIYAGYQSFTKLSEERAKTRAAQILANKAATPGKLSSQKPTSKKPVSEMTSEEFAVYDEKVKSGKIKIE